MHHFLIALFLASAITARAQGYSFANAFHPGTIVLKDSSTRPGQVKWFPSQNQKLRFRENEKDDAKKYSPDELIGFTVDSLSFKSLFNFEAMTEDYALQGKTLKIKQTFGQLLDSGTFNIYFVTVTGVSPLNGVGNYENFIFEKITGGSPTYVAFPRALRMKDKRYEKAKENLYAFFQDYPQAIGKIKAFRQEQDFYEVIDLLKTLN